MRLSRELWYPLFHPALTGTMNSARIKHTCPWDIGIRGQLLGILSFEVNVLKLIPTSDAVVIHTATYNDADAGFKDDIPTRLVVGGFPPIVFPKFRPQCTVHMLRPR